MSNIRFNVINLYQCAPGFVTKERIFDFDYLLYVHEGKGIYKIGNATYKAVMGDIFYCPPSVRNTIIADSEAPFLLSGLEFHAPLYRGTLKQSISLLRDPFLIQSIKQMVQECQYKKNGYEKICEALLKVLLENLLRYSQESVSNRHNSTQEILEYISMNLHRTITHHELSTIFSYHKNSINRLLIQETGLSLKNYMIELRIQRSSELLKYSSKSISEIAELCGYNSTTFFSRQFREKNGITPMQCRSWVYLKSKER